MKFLLIVLSSFLFAFGSAGGQEGPGAPASPPETAAAVIGGAKITIDYSAPSVRGRKIFGPGGRVMQDPNAPIWRAGANSATTFHTSADLLLGNLAVPKGEYTLYVNVQNPDAWELIVSKQTGQWGLTYSPAEDLGRVKMQMSKPPALIETLKYTMTQTGPKQGRLQLAWENHVSSVPITVK